MRKQFLLDIDGCILNWLGGFVIYMKELGFNQEFNIPITYGLGKFFGIDQDIVNKHIRIFNEGHWQFGILQELEGAKKGLHILHYDLEFDLIAISSCSDKPQSLALRRVNLFHTFGDIFSDVHCIKTFGDKRPLLKSYEPTFWLEDKVSNAVHGHEVGHDALLLDQPHNRNEHDDRVSRCKNWEHIIEVVKSRS